MKTIKILSLALASSTLFLSCKKEVKLLSKIKKTPKNELVIVDTTIIEEKTKKNSDYLYVTSFSGLSLRAYANLQSEKLAVMPYGTKVKVVFLEKKPTMKVGNIVGGMNEVEYNHKKGFAFNGYLSKYFPPEKKISAKRYSEELKFEHSAVKYSKSKSGTVSNPIITEKLIIPDAEWHEAFYMAQQLYEFPKEFEFPSSKGKEKEIKLEKKFMKDSWVSELQINRKENRFTKIEYHYKNKGFNKVVSIYKESGQLIICNTEEIK
jgi:hypothetical protein